MCTRDIIIDVEYGSKLALLQEVCDVKFEAWISLSSMMKLLHTIESNKDVDIAFDEYITHVIRIITIYVKSEEEYILKRRSKDREVEPSKGSGDY